MKKRPILCMFAPLGWGVYASENIKAEEIKPPLTTHVANTDIIRKMSIKI